MLESDYQNRGQRVATMLPAEILALAENVSKIMKIDKSITKRMDFFIDNLWSEYGINLEVVDDNNWLHGVADAWCDPSLLTITIPEKLYKKIVKKKHEASIFILFHELGHLLLGHKAVLHHDGSTGLQYFENSEWQADYFSEAIMINVVERRKGKQLSLF